MGVLPKWRVFAGSLGRLTSLTFIEGNLVGVRRVRLNINGTAVATLGSRKKFKNLSFH